jgi:DNA polymerase-3 subunit alpha
MERVDEYIKRKHGKKKIRFDHPLLEKALSDTYGVMIYQEQVMQTANILAGFSLGQADLLRKAMGKKISEIMDEQRKVFLKGTAEREIHPDIAEDVFDQMERFAGYGFNKAHSTAYSQISYRTAYLKAHYPIEFMAANLTSELNDTPRITVLINECRNMGIEVLPPSINESTASFSVSGKKIRFGLGAIKNVGLGAIESIVESRNKEGSFTTLPDFCRRVDLRLVNKRVIESLILSGAMDSLEGKRAQLYAVVDDVISRAQRYQQEENSRQTSLFDGGNGEELDVTNLGITLPDIEEWPLVEKLNKERELLGFYISGHPLLRFESEILSLASCNIAEIKELNDNEECTIGGIVLHRKEITDKKGKQMAFLTLEDFTGDIEILLFSDIYDSCKNLLDPDAMLLVKGLVSSSGEKEGVKLIATAVFNLKRIFDTESSQFASFEMTEKASSFDENNLVELKNILSAHKGKCPVFLRLETVNDSVLRLQMKKTGISPSKNLLGALRSRFPDVRIHMKLNNNRSSRTNLRKVKYSKN